MTRLFITFEGIDGCGKTTQARLLVQVLQARGRPVVHTREPGGTPLGEGIRSLFLHPGGHELSAPTEILLMAADRADHVESLLRPALARGEVVVCERYVDSSLAYQGYGREADAATIQRIREINAFATGGLVPDITFLLDVAPQLARQRQSQEPDRIEARAMAFHQRVRQGYLCIAREEPHRVVVIDASPSPERVHEKIVEALAAWHRTVEAVRRED